MSERWPGGIVRSTPVTPTGPLQNGTAPGIWTMEQAAYWTKQGLWPTAGNFLAVEDVFSTWLYTGNGSTQTITNGINLSGQGGLVWSKNRSFSADHLLYDTSRGTNKRLATNTTNGTGVEANQLNSFNSNGFTLGGDGALNAPNRNAEPYASYTFREAANFFDVVTYSGTGSVQNIPHSLGSVPGCIFVKRTDTSSNWQVYHRSLGNTQYLVLNTTAVSATGTTRWNSTTPTSSVFTVGTDATVNASGGTYVAYLFAHDTSATGIIQCGSLSSTSAGSVNLGWEPQWVLWKTSDTSVADWYIFDSMRGFSTNPNTSVGKTSFYANTSAAEFAASGVAPTATGLSYSNIGANSVYIAIRRGPMRTPTSGTSVFAPFTFTGNGTTTNSTTNFPVDLMFDWTNASQNFYWMDRLRGSYYLQSDGTGAEVLGDASNGNAAFDFANNVQSSLICPRAGSGNTNKNAQKQALYNFRRAPSFFDEVCYTGTGVASTINHNLGVAPELMIVKARTATGGGVNPSWAVYSQATGNTKALFLDQTSAGGTSINYWNNTTPTSSVFSTGAADATNASATPYVAYLFASCPGVSKVGSYTGTGTTQTINCGFTTGARFVLIKRTDSTGDWYVWDSARGIVAGNDPYLLLNSTAAEVTGTDYIDTDNSGFQISSTAPAAINANGGTFIYLAIS